ncbi:hypothetical protein TRFO_17787 [Tritrichomonas foetus]|uniref:Outer dense fiber protein 3 n=1 Tax=Tritrichomonas foetus TaxID=1144522 RepID=A0A1J4KNC7_9EUKA|nr:hypothetical protein TRFO_17787 [Tritrichomonas foetus]|eukprot:OHT12408.1 hypothetical protein TRFO_17787 [Tritrichomonas foetus]
MGKETWARRLGKENLPGPADYTTRTEPGCDSPRYSIKNVYPENVRRLDPSFSDIPTTVGDAPKFTIRPMTSIPDGNDNPGPTYIPHPLGYDYLKRKNGTMRQRSFSLDRRQPKYKSYSQSPFGPAKYDSRYHPGDKKDPVYSIGEHCGESWIKTNDNPSGAAYRPKIDITKPTSPRHSIHQRVEDPQPPETPGPGEYSIPTTLGRRPNSIHIHHKDFQQYNTPGPGKYDIPDTMGTGGPKHSIHPLCPQKVDHQGVPYRKIKREFDECKTRSIHGKCPELKGFETPGPGAYSPASTWNSGRGARMSPRSSKKELWGSIYDGWRSPGPCEYDPDVKPTLPSEPKYSLHDNVGIDWQGPKNNVPGPGMYGANLDDPGKRRSPRFTIRPKTVDIIPKSATQDAGYVRLTKFPFEKPAMSIHLREELDLIPE